MEPIIARVYVVPTDLGIYLTALLLIILTQLLIWGIARYSTDIEIWRCLGLCLATGGATSIGMLMGDGGNLLAAWFFGAFVAYLLAGFIYDFELWQRLVVTAVTPILVGASFVGGYWLKDVIYTHLLS